VSSKCTLEDNAPRRVHEEKAWMAVSAQEMLQREGAGDSDWIAVTNRLLDFVSEVVQHDQPLCPDCTEIMVADLEKELRSSEAERDHYCGFLKEWEAEDEAMITAQERQLNKELQQLEKEEAQLMQELQQIEAEQEAVKRESAVMAKEKEELDAQVEAYWKSCNECLVKDAIVSEKAASVHLHLQTEMEELTKLNRTNILNEAFHIWFDGHFGTINNFRLGKMPSEQVEWNEINAAWGHAALLLHTIARMRKVQWTKHTVVPMGSFSTVEPGRYELYGGAPVFWASTRFDKAMVGFLFCLNEVLKEVHNAQEDKEAYQIPYEVQDDKVGGLTIKLVGNEGDKWTQALKYMLTDLKWLVGMLSTFPTKES
jgi:beclin 1